MCARAQIIATISEIRLAYKPQGQPVNIAPLWNGAPTHDFPVLRRNPKTGERSIDLLRWGLVPHWSKDEKSPFSTINAKAETIAAKPAFRDAWRGGRRCIIPLNAFYEWKTLPDGRKKPYAFSRVDGEMLSVAGLWDSKRLPSGEILRTFTIITTTANTLVAVLHDRMPVILAAEDIPLWLGEAEAPLDMVAALMRPCPPEWLKMTPIDPRMSNVRNQGAEYCQPLSEREAETLSPQEL